MARALPKRKKKIAPPTEVGKLKERMRTLSQKLSESVPKDEMESRLKEFRLWKLRSRKLNKSQMDKLQVKLNGSESRIQDLQAEGSALQKKLESDLDESNKKILDIEEKLRESRETIESERETIRELEGGREESGRKLHLLESRVLELEGIVGGMISREELDKSVRRSADLEKELGQVRTDLYSSQSRISEVEANNSQLESRLEGSVSKEQHDDRINELNSKLTELQVRIAEGAVSQEEMDQCRKRVEESGRKLHLLESRVLELEGIVGGMISREELDKSVRRSADLEKELGQVRTDLYSSQSRISEVEANNSQLESRLEGSVSKEQHDDRINELNSKLTELQVRIAEGAVSQEEMDQCRKRVEELKSELALARDTSVRSATE